MRFRLSSYLAVGVPLVVVFYFAVRILISMPASAQDVQNKGPAVKPAVPSNEQLDEKAYLALPVAKLPTPQAADGHPDLSGFYMNGGGGAEAKRGADGNIYYNFDDHVRAGDAPSKRTEPSLPSYKPEYAAKAKAAAGGELDFYFDVYSPNDPQWDCKPPGIPRASGAMQIVQTPGLVVILYESSYTSRLIYTSGRKHPEDFDSSYYGDSIGHWDGDTLVVDVVGLNDETWLGPVSGGLALIHSDQEHVVERYTRHGNMLFYDATVEDPVMFTKPWVIPTRHLLLDQDGEYYESICTPSAADKSHIKYQPYRGENQFHPPSDAK
jgi:hypothetical protein